MALRTRNGQDPRTTHGEIVDAELERLQEYARKVERLRLELAGRMTMWLSERYELELCRHAFISCDTFTQTHNSGHARG